MGWFSRHKPGAPGDGSGPGTKPPPLPYPFQTLSDFAFRPASNLAATPVAAVKRGLVRRLFARLSWKYRLMIAAPAIGALGLSASLATMMVYYTVTFPHPLSLRNKERAPVIRICRIHIGATGYEKFCNIEISFTAHIPVNTVLVTGI